MELEALLAESEWIGALAGRLVRDVHGAEDLAQETRLAALRHRPGGQTSTRPWLATVARNGARLLRRSTGTREAREADRAREQAAQVGLAPEELLANLESQQRVSRLVRELPPELCDVILLSFYEGLSSADIGKLREIPAGTVRWRKKQALELLRERLDDQHDGKRSAWLAALVPLTRPSWRKGTKVASGGAGTGGILATWIAMSTASKAVALAVLLALCSLPLWGGGETAPITDQKSVVLADGSQLPIEAAKEKLLADALPLPASAERVEAPVDEAPGPQGVGRPVTRVQLRVVDAQGRPVARATVTPRLSYELEQANESALQDISPLRLLALKAKLVQVTESDGMARWETDLLQESGVVDFEAVGADYAVGSVSEVLEVGAAMDLGDLTLAPAGSVAGRVLMSDGSQAGRHFVKLARGKPPTEGAELLAWTIDFNPTSVDTSVTAADGAFRFVGVEPGEYFVFTQAPDNSGRVASESFQVIAGKLVDGVQLVRAADTASPPRVVVFGADGKPLVGAYVNLIGSQRGHGGTVNREGEWNFMNTYSHFAGGRLEVSDNTLQHRGQVIDPLPMEPQTIEVHLVAAELTERKVLVVGANGEPVEEFSITIATAEGARTWQAQGNAASLQLPAYPGATFKCIVRARGFEEKTLDDMRSFALPEEWSIQVNPLTGIRGRVVRAGDPVAKAKVVLQRLVTDNRVRTGGDEVTRIEGQVDQGITGKDGEFMVFAPDAGDYVLSISASRSVDAVLDLGELSGLDAIDPLLVELNKGGELRGSVRDPNGDLVPGAYLVLSHPYHDLIRKRSGKDGSYRFRKVPQGNWYLRQVSSFEETFIMGNRNVPEGWEYPTNCHVVAGEVSTFDLDLAPEAGAYVGGYWSALGAEDSVWTAELSCGGWGSNRLDPFLKRWQSQVELQAGEEFRIDAAAGREYSLAIQQANNGSVLRRTVEADELPLVISREFAFAQLELQAPASQSTRASTGQLYLTWAEGKWTFNRSLQPDEQGRYGPLLVPAGSMHVSWEVLGQEAWGELQLELEPGEERLQSLE